MSTTLHNRDYIVRLTGWADFIAWANLIVAAVAGLAQIGQSAYDLAHPEILAVRAASYGQLPADVILQQMLSGVYTIALGLAGFIFLKALAQILFILIDFEANTRPQRKS